MQGNEGRNTKAAALAWLIVTGLVTMAAATAMAQDETVADVTVDFHADGMGFDITSSQGLSNVIVLLCDGTVHKHESEFGGAIMEWSHTEDQIVQAVWVKSGENHDPTDPAPPAPFNNTGAGEHFANDVTCEEVPTDGTPDGNETDDGNQTDDGNETDDGNQTDDGNETDGPDGNETDDGAGDQPVCMGPSDVRAVTSGPTVVVSWSSVEGATAYHVYRAMSGGEASLLVTTAGDVTEHRDTTVEAGVTYTYHVTAMVDGAETDACDSIQVTAIPVFPSVLAMLAAAFVGLGAYTATRRRP